MMKSTLVVLMLALPFYVVQAFVVKQQQKVAPHTRGSSASSSSSMSSPLLTSSIMLFMSEHPSPHQGGVGETEQLLLDYKERKTSGVVQEIGKTVKNDGLDGLRSMVWSVYHISEYVFPILGIMLAVGVCLNVTGYGYYVEPDTGKFVVASLKFIQQEQYLQMEATKLAVTAAERATLF